MGNGTEMRCLTRKPAARRARLSPARAGHSRGHRQALPDERPGWLPSGPRGAHNEAVTDGRGGAVCPRCDRADAVHSIVELAALARTRLGDQPPGPPVPPQPGYAAEPQAGPVPGYAADPGTVPGWAAQPRSGPLPGGPQGSRVPRPAAPAGSGGDGLPDGLSLEGDIASAAAAVAASAAARFLGRAIGRRVQRTYEQRVLPALAARQQALLHEQIAIAERHPDLRACLTDQVIFLAGGTRTVPLASVTGMLTLEQSDALVAELRSG